jgi:hypothetical protein
LDGFQGRNDLLGEMMFVNREMILLELWSVMGKMAVGYCTLAIVSQIRAAFPRMLLSPHSTEDGTEFTPPKYISP